MQRVLVLVALLLGVGWLAVEYELPSGSEPAVVESSWRRTANGWEESDRWLPTPYSAPPALNPRVVAALQAMLSVTALVAFPSRRAGVS